MLKLKRFILVLCLFTAYSSLFSQTFIVSQNVLSTSLYQPFTSEGGYTLSFERMIDPGYSRNVAQFSYRMNMTLISSNSKAEYIRLDSQVFYDDNAYQYRGYSVLPEIKYYFTWDAPMGVYMNIFGNYTDYTLTYTDISIGDYVSEQSSFSKIGRGIGAGFQFKLLKEFTIDLVGGYHIQNITSKTKFFGNDETIDNPDEQDEKLYMNIHFGISF